MCEKRTASLFCKPQEEYRRTVSVRGSDECVSFERGFYCVKIKSVNLDIVIGITSRLPETGQTEIAFAGRSNVGKSSLINALILRKNYARTSSQPGKTQTINYYHVNDSFYLVDLPGYGYAKVPEEVRKKWGQMIERYLNRSADLKAVLLLVDMRHEPNANDCQMHRWIIESGRTPIVIATKADKLSRNERAKMQSVIRKKLEMKKEEKLIAFSAETKEGRDEIAVLIDRILEPAELRTAVSAGHTPEAETAAEAKPAPQG